MNEQRYREAERRLWQESGAVPTERRVRLERLGVDVRVMEVGDGPPLIFLHGGPGAGSGWAALAARLTDFRCIVPDRPGTGLSDHLRLDRRTIRPFAETFAADVLDALAIERADLAGSSTGSYLAFRSSIAHPSRFGRTVHLGCPDFIEGMAFPLTVKLMLLPGVRRLLTSVPASEKGFLASLSNIGHGPAIKAGKVPRAAIEWGVALQRDTPTFRNELESMAGMYTFRGPSPELLLSRAELAQVSSPTLFLWGDNDPFGSVELGRELAAAMPTAHIEVMAGAGHLPWVDDADHVARRLKDHLRG